MIEIYRVPRMEEVMNEEEEPITVDQLDENTLVEIDGTKKNTLTNDGS